MENDELQVIFLDALMRVGDACIPLTHDSLRSEEEQKELMKNITNATFFYSYVKGCLELSKIPVNYDDFKAGKYHEIWREEFNSQTALKNLVEGLTELYGGEYNPPSNDKPIYDDFSRTQHYYDD